MRIAIVGAGFAGLSTARTLKAFGHRVTVFDKTPDVGGVWSATRRYPGLTTQNPRDTYALSDYPMPRHYPEWPTGEQVQAYLQSYAEHMGLVPDLRLSTEVTAATLDETRRRWTLKTRLVRGTAMPSPESTEEFDYMVVCNGIFCDPAVPRFAGADDFTAAGGRVCHTSELHDVEDARGKHVVVVGYGKSSCDVAAALSDVSASTTVVARQLIWKIPKLLAGKLNFKVLLLSRMGEALFRYIELRGVERFLHGRGLPVRNAMLGSVQSVVTRQLRLRELKLHPGTPLETIARSTVSLATDGFFDRVASGRLAVRRDCEIERLWVQDGRRMAKLTDGTTVPADVVVCGTGFHQRVPFLEPALLARVTDSRGNFRLFRSMLPVDVPCLAFNGYNSSFFSQLNAEMGALWLAAHLAGGLRLPPAAEQLEIIDARLRWMEARTDGKHSKGTNIIPFSMHHIDELLRDLDLDVSRATRSKQWLAAVDPGAYATMLPRLLARLGPTAMLPGPDDHDGRATAQASAPARAAQRTAPAT